MAAKPEILASGYGLVEGPRADAKGSLYFSDVLLGGVYRRVPEGEIEIVGAIILPGLVMGLLFFAPFIGRFRLGHRFNTALLGLLGIGVVGLTFMAVYEDRNDPLHEKAVNIAEENADRAVLLARWIGTHKPSLSPLSTLRPSRTLAGTALLLTTASR